MLAIRRKKQQCKRSNCRNFNLPLYNFVVTFSILERGYDEGDHYLLFLSHDHHIAEDLVQETFYRAYLYLEDCHEDRIKPWLFKVAYHVFIDYVRKGSRNIVIQADFFERISDSHNTENVLVNKEFWEEIYRAIGRLPTNQQQALLLYDFHDLTYKEAADIMEISLSHFKIVLFRARQQLRQYRERMNAIDRRV